MTKRDRVALIVGASFTSLEMKKNQHAKAQIERQVKAVSSQPTHRSTTTTDVLADSAGTPLSVARMVKL